MEYFFSTDFNISKEERAKTERLQKWLDEFPFVKETIVFDGAELHRKVRVCSCEVNVEDTALPRGDLDRIFSPTRRLVHMSFSIQYSRIDETKKGETK